MRFQGKVTVVTGASSGIGRALAGSLLAEGAIVVAVARRHDRLEQLIQDRCSAEGALVLAADVSRYGELRRVVSAAVERYGRIDVVVNNAGVGYGGPLAELTPAEIEYTTRVNLLAPMWLTQLALPILLEQAEALIVNVSSFAALAPLPLQSAYSASKFGLSGFSRSLERELWSTNVRLVTVYPGYVDTEMIPESARPPGQRGATAPLSADEAARRILAAIKRGKRKILVAKSPMRFLPAIEAVAPKLVSLLMRPMLKELPAMMRSSTEQTRRRNPLPGPEPE